MELSGYLGVIRRWWWTLLVAAWVAGLAGYAVASRITPTYESTVKLLTAPINTDIDTLKAAGQLVQTYAQVVTTEPVLDSTIQELGLTMKPAALAQVTRATANDVTRILTIQVQDSDPKRAADLANTMATEMVQLVSRGVSRPEGELLVIQAAVPGTAPVAPQVSLIVLLSAAAGVMAAIVMVLLVEYFSRSVRTRDELATLAGVPVVGTVPALAGTDPRVGDLLDQRSTTTSTASAYRMLTARVTHGDPDHPVRDLAVTDVESEGAAAVVALNIGLSLAQLGRQVVVIEGGSSGILAGLLGLAPSPGVSELASGEARPRDARRRLVDRLTLVPAGLERPATLDADGARALVAELRGRPTWPS